MGRRASASHWTFFDQARSEAAFAKETDMSSIWAKPLAATLMATLLGWITVQAEPPDRGEMKTVRGKVVRFTTAPKGEIDGAVLEDDIVIHWPPHLEERFKGIIDKGDRVEATGWQETGPQGDKHLEVRTLTNLRTKVSRENDDAPPPPPKGPGPKGKAKDAPPPPPPAAVDRPAPNNAKSLEQRVQALEDKIDQLTRQLERLQRKQ
jgi:hypothetical protein